MQREMISIVIPTYNRGKIISQTINSVISQTYRNWECIVVDDFSTDDTRQIISKISHQEKRVKYIVNKGAKGAQGARNTGIKEACGKWIAFLDSDDEWVPNKLEQQMKVLDEKNFDPYTMVHGNCILYDHELNTQTVWDLPKTDGIKPFELLLQRASPLFPTILTSKKALEEVGYLDENVPSYQEWDTALLLSRLCNFVHIENPLFIYHYHKGDTMSKNKRRDIAGHHYILMKYKNDILEHFGKQYFIDVLLGNIRRVIAYKEWKFGAKLVRESKPFLPLKSFLLYLTCFRLQLDPNSIRNIVLKRN
ncbi:MAG: glycosyltransferase family 2 protein [Flavisolibacter sp.]